MPKITAYNLVHAISNLDRSKDYNYINEKTPGKIHIEHVQNPAGPIQIRRWNPNKGQSYDTAKVESISSEMIWRVANAFTENEPLMIDRILGASYNTRAVLETLIALTPEFHFCYPGRIKDIDGHSSIEHGHKHLLWLPNEPHQNGVPHKKDVQGLAVSEIPIQSVTYDNLLIPDSMMNTGLDIDVLRRHTQIQIALYLIGLQLGYRTWIAQNDMGIKYKDVPLIEQPGVVKRLSNENMIGPYDGAENAGRLIDCIWFRNGRFMPAVMEVEHTTGVTSGLTRMLGLYERLPHFETRYVIVAPDEDREMVIEKINKPEFKPLNARYFSYSSVEELYSFCIHRKLHGITDEFLDCYMEKVCVA